MQNIEIGILILVVTSIANVISRIVIYNKEKKHSFEQNRNKFILGKLQSLEDSFSQLVIQIQYFNENDEKEISLIEEKIKLFNIDFQKSKYLMRNGKFIKLISMFITSIEHDPSLKYEEDIKQIWIGIGNSIARRLNYDE